jgi:general secretion pathway protein K
MNGRSEEGIALIAVLWMLTLLSVIAVALSLETSSNTHIARNMAENAAARVAADAGIRRAILDLISVPDIKTMTADGTVYNWRFANSTIHVSVQNELSKVNLNEAPEAALVALFASAGADPGKAQSLADAVADFRDPDNLVRPHGAEEAEYRAAGLAWRPKNAPFDAVEELQQVLGMTAEIFKRVATRLTIYSVGAGGIFFGERVYSIHAEAEGPNRATFEREAVVRLVGANHQILAWQQGAGTDSRRTLSTMLQDN